MMDRIFPHLRLRRYSIPRNFNKALENFKSGQISPPLVGGSHPSFPRQRELEQAIVRTVSYLRDIQDGAGYWVGELESNVSITAEYLMLFHYLDCVDEEKEKAMVNYLLREQLENGAWSIFYGHLGDLSTTVEAYFALKLAGLSPEDSRMRKAREFILSNGGMLGCRAMTRICLGLFGEFDWRGIPIMPVELMLMPPFFLFNIYNFSSWARAIVVPLLVLFSLRPIKELPPEKRLDELYPIPKEELDYSFERSEKWISWRNFFVYTDKVLRFVEKSPVKFTRSLALKKAEQWILDHQLETGDCAGIFPAMANTLMALHALGYSLHSKPIQKGLEALERFEIREGDTLRIQACVSPVWDTAWTAYALSTAGYTAKEDFLAKALDWLFEQQVDVEGDWIIRNPGVVPGGWAFEFHNDLAPDTDDTAVVLMALLGDDLESNPQKLEEFKRGLNWLLSMQNDDGGWGAFERNNNQFIYNEHPFSESDNLLDPSTSDVTGRVLEAVGQMGMNKRHPMVRKALQFLRKEQEAFGAWYGRWGVNYIYGTWSVLAGLRSVGEDMSQSYVQKAVSWLKSIQNDDGGWGESCLSYVDPDWIGKGNSCASQTAWAVMALLAAGEVKSDSLQKGVDFLLRTQQKDGSWQENEFTGTGFPEFFLIKYHMYSIYFPLLALARYRRYLFFTQEEK
ncbi:MAG: squalene--hopene cyclase [Planctomycetota bacterium]|nr:MAG: squalene--hopene cyclase [Planctomycetota bacterium]